MRKYLPFLILLAFVAVSRMAVVLSSQTHVDSDEAIIGLMARHISKGLSYPFYMYGQAYNACASWEAYCASIVFAIFGVGVIQLKSCVVMLSLLTLACFYRMVLQVFGQKIAWCSSFVLALFPSLFKWDFRSYSFYFIAIPVLAGLFFAIESKDSLNWRKFFVFGLICGLSVLGLELILPLVAAFWGILTLRRLLSVKNSIIGLGGFLIGYLPAILYNLTHHYVNWQTVFLQKAGAPSGIFHFSVIKQILLVEMPKFFGPDTILWYYPETSLIGWIFYGIALVAVVVALVPFVKTPSKIKLLFTPGTVLDDEHKDLLVFVLTLACFIPYVVAPIRVPGYFLGGCFFMAILIARLICKSFASSSLVRRGAGVMLVLAILIGGLAVEIQTAYHNQIETLGLNSTGQGYHMERIPGSDIDAIERQLAMDKVDSTWATPSFVYPLIFETDEKIAVSSSIFGFDNQVYPPTVTRREPDRDLCESFVCESDSPLLPLIESRCAKAGGSPPLIVPCGTLTVIEARILKQPEQ